MALLKVSVRSRKLSSKVSYRYLSPVSPTCVSFCPSRPRAGHRGCEGPVRAAPSCFLARTASRASTFSLPGCLERSPSQRTRRCTRRFRAAKRTTHSPPANAAAHSCRSSSTQDHEEVRQAVPRNLDEGAARRSLPQGEECLFTRLSLCDVARSASASRRSCALEQAGPPAPESSALVCASGSGKAELGASVAHHRPPLLLSASLYLTDALWLRCLRLRGTSTQQNFQLRWKPHDASALRLSSRSSRECIPRAHNRLL